MVFYNICIQKLLFPVNRCVAIKISASNKINKNREKYTEWETVQCLAPQHVHIKLCCYHILVQPKHCADYHMVDKWLELESDYEQCVRYNWPLTDRIKKWLSDYNSGQDYYWAVATEIMLRIQYETRHRAILPKNDFGHETRINRLYGMLEGYNRPAIDGIGS